MKTFILLCALPGSGKSTWSEQYRLTHKNVFVVSSDDLRKELGGSYQNFDHEEEVWVRFLEDILKFRDVSDDVTVIADSTNIYNKFRKYYANEVKGFDKKILVIIKKDYKTILEANQIRNPNKIVPEFAIKAMWDQWEDPDDEIRSLYDEVTIIDKWFDSPDVKKEFHYK